LIGLTYKVMTKRFVVAWDTGAIATVYMVAVGLSYLLTRLQGGDVTPPRTAEAAVQETAAQWDLQRLAVR
jgi:hypothetical protein